MKRRLALLAAALVACCLFARPARAFDVALPDADNLQYMTFWVALGAGYFADEGVDVRVIAPETPAGIQAMVQEHKASAFVLPPPVYVPLIAQKEPIVLVANLLQNDPIDLVVRRTLLDERKLPVGAPLRERLAALHGLRIGVAPGPPTRLRALFHAVGLDADHDIQMVILHGKDQNEGFAAGTVDALYAHTPYLETALLEQGAEMYVNQSGGEPAELASRQIHALAVTRRLLEQEEGRVLSLVRAIARAGALIHQDLPKAIEALEHALPAIGHDHLACIATIYEPAIPATPAVSADGVAGALAFFPASKSPPDLTGIDLREYFAPYLLERASRRSSPWRFFVFGGAAAGAVAVLVILAKRGRRPRREVQA